MKTREALADIQRRIENARRKHDKELILVFRHHDGEADDDYTATLGFFVTPGEHQLLRTGCSRIGFAEALSELAHTRELQDKEFG